jgi:hypothetical protein
VGAIHRAPMRARDLDVPAGAGAEFGLRHGLVGIGDTAERRIARLADLPEGALVWTRDTDGRFHLGAIAGPMRQEDSAAARAVGITHVRPVEWLDRPFGEGEVPPAVPATFARGGRNLQRIHDRPAEERSAELWATCRGTATRRR